MTIATRNRFIRIATVFAFSLVVLSIVSGILILMRHLLPDTAPGFRPIRFPDGFFLTAYSPLASIASIAVFPCFALAGLIYILFAFEKTQTVEITFFAACVFALAFEAIRMFIPLYQLWIHAGFYMVTISHFIYFCRIFTILALLLSGIMATVKTAQQLGPSIFLLAFFSFSLSNAIPINSINIRSNFLVPSGYQGTIDLFFLIIGCLSVLTYLISGKTRGIPEYNQASVGIVLLLAGYVILTLCDTWLFFFGGSLLLFSGTWIYLRQIHTYYLWQ